MAHHKVLQAMAERLRAAGCVYAEDEAAVLLEASAGPDGSADLAGLEALVARRVAGEPLEVIVGWADFGGVRVLVGPGVFVPRQRSLALVDLAVAGRPRRLLDLGCGSGALAVAVRRQVPALEVWAVDVDPVAVSWAERNLGESSRVICGSWFDPLPEQAAGSFDVIVANAPYVPTDEVVLMPTEARYCEPRWALDGGADGLDHHRVLIGGAPRWLAPGGRLLIEVAPTQAEAALGLMQAAGLAGEVVEDARRAAWVVAGTLAVSVHGDRPR